MKKINSTKLMAVLAALCLVTSSFVGSTLAKYITTANSNDAARVAKFGVVLQADGKLYGEDYVDNIIVGETAPAASELAVQSSVDGENVVAPGTKNDKGLNFSINGTPEVATRLNAEFAVENIYLDEGTYAVMVKAPTVTADSFEADKYYTKTGDTYALAASWADATEYYTMTDKAEVAAKYYPVVYSTEDALAQYDEEDVGIDTLDSIIDGYYISRITSQGKEVEYNTEVVDGKKTYTVQADFYPNYDYANLYMEGESLTWEWYFENGDPVDEYYNGIDVYTYDAADTILGHLMAGELEGAEVIDVETMKAPVAANGTEAGDYNLETSFGVKFTVTQLDKEVGNAENN